MTDDLFNIKIFLNSETLRPMHEAAIIESYSQKINKSGISMQGSGVECNSEAFRYKKPQYSCIQEMQHIFFLIILHCGKKKKL